MAEMDAHQSEIVDGVWMRFCKFREKSNRICKRETVFSDKEDAVFDFL